MHEIQKLYTAAGWDADNLTYTGKTQPIKWVRVHNLPDFAYFNHSQHVTVAGIRYVKLVTDQLRLWMKYINSLH